MIKSGSDYRKKGDVSVRLYSIGQCLAINRAKLQWNSAEETNGCPSQVLIRSPIAQHHLRQGDLPVVSVPVRIPDALAGGGRGGWCAVSSVAETGTGRTGQYPVAMVGFDQSPIRHRQCTAPRHWIIRGFHRAVCNQSTVTTILPTC